MAVLYSLIFYPIATFIINLYVSMQFIIDFYSFQNMINTQFSSNTQLIDYLKQSQIIKSQMVYYTLLSIDRKSFIPQPPYYIDKASPIGHGAIISAPHMHAYALQYLHQKLRKAKLVLDVGSGSGLLTLAMALLTPKDCLVYGIEHVPQLVQQSIKSIQKQNRQILSKIKIIVGDGRNGWPDGKVKFDVIHVGAATEKVPDILVHQLSQDGVIIIPIGKQLSPQNYMRIEKKNGKIYQTILQCVCYVPLTNLQYQKIR